MDPLSSELLAAGLDSFYISSLAATPRFPSCLRAVCLAGMVAGEECWAWSEQVVTCHRGWEV